MVQRCCVPFCETKVGDADINGVKVRFHRMPMVPERFQLWRSRITNNDQYKPEPDLTVNSRICSKHFVRQDYLDCCQNKPVTGNHILAKDAVPSRFRWSTDNCDVSAAIPFVRRVKPTTTSPSPQSTSPHHTPPHHANNKVSAQQHHRQQQQQQPTFTRPHPPTFSSRAYATKDKSCVTVAAGCIEHGAVEKQTQCSFEDERLKNEISRKNSIIQQLLERISQLEAEHKATTQILLKDTLSVGTPTSVIKCTSPYNHQNVPREQIHKDKDNFIRESWERESGNNNNNNGVGVVGKKRKFVEYDDENIHYVLLSLSEKVVRHDNNNGMAQQTAADQLCN